MHLNQIQFMLYHERDGKKPENASFVHIVYLSAKLCNICDEAFFIDVSIYIFLYIPKTILDVSYDTCIWYSLIHKNVCVHYY